ncbi:hypothetical protein LOTGIDRAFT_122298, partial [Lottia gigantea]
SFYFRPCSEDSSYETIDILPDIASSPSIKLTDDTPVSNRTEPLTGEEFQSFLDQDGRLVNEIGLRKAIFLGSVDSSIRKQVWQFLFGLYPCTSTKRERDALLIDYIIKYHELKNRWKTMLVIDSKPGDTEIKTKYTPRPLDLSLLDQTNISEHINTPDMEQKIEFMKIQAQVYVQRQRLDIEELKNQIRVIDKDVPRTDRDEEFFRGAGNPRLTELREILITFAGFSPDLGYAQGMNDILARFLYVMGSEVETFWCFYHYMEKIKEDFMEVGMVKKIELVKMLLGEIDNSLLHHFECHDMGNLFFCHRWLLLGFKREFTFQDSLKCFEILSSQHLELSSMEAETAVRREEMKEFANTGDLVLYLFFWLSFLKLF